MKGKLSHSMSDMEESMGGSSSLRPHIFKQGRPLFPADLIGWATLDFLFSDLLAHRGGTFWL